MLPNNNNNNSNSPEGPYNLERMQNDILNFLLPQLEEKKLNQKKKNQVVSSKRVSVKKRDISKLKSYDRYVRQKEKNLEFIINESVNVQEPGKNNDFGYMNSEIPAYLKKELGLIKKKNISPYHWRKKYKNEYEKINRSDFIEYQDSKVVDGQESISQLNNRNANRKAHNYSVMVGGDTEIVQNTSLDSILPGLADNTAELQ